MTLNGGFVSIIGAGTMGNGIAHVFAQAGFNVFEFSRIDTATHESTYQGFLYIPPICSAYTYYIQYKIIIQPSCQHSLAGA